MKIASDTTDCTMNEKTTLEKSLSKKVSANSYELEPPEGGWGFVIVAAMSVFFAVTIVPMTTFGVIYGSFLASIGDETSGTAIANSMFNTSLCITGLAANQLLQKMSYRKVGLLGAVIYFAGAFTCIFVTTLFQVIISFGVIQGVGFGLMLPSIFTAFNHYFDKRKNFLMSISQATIVAVTIAFPVLSRFLIDEYGFRGTVALLAAYSLNCIPMMMTLQPVKWHMKRKIVTQVAPGDVLKINSYSEVKKTTIEAEPLMMEHHPNLHNNLLAHVMLNQSKRSLVSVGSMAMSVTSINKVGKVEDEPKSLGLWQTVSKALDLGLFKDATYVNISMGLSLSITADLTFLALLPLLLVNAGFDGQQLTLILTVYFVSDLVCRISFSVLTAFVDVKNRYMFLAGALLSALFRIAFVMSNSFWWIMCISSALGFLRTLIQTPLPLVVAEEYPQRFVTAFSLYMVVCGVIAMVCGLLASLIKQLTHSDTMVLHMLTILYLLCAVPWLIEIVYTRFARRKP